MESPVRCNRQFKVDSQTEAVTPPVIALSLQKGIASRFQGSASSYIHVFVAIGNWKSMQEAATPLGIAFSFQYAIEDICSKRRRLLLESRCRCNRQLKVESKRRRLLLGSIFLCNRQFKFDSKRRRLLLESRFRYNRQVKIDSKRRRLLLGSRLRCNRQLKVESKRRCLLLESRFRCNR